MIVEPRCCTPRRLHPLVEGIALQRAVVERPDNHPLGLGALELIAQQGAAAKQCLWSPGRTIRVKFLGGDSHQRKMIWRALQLWQTCANLGFVQSTRDTPSDVRVSFEAGKGSWSYLGTDALAVPFDQPTMNIGWGPDLPTCLHECGHMLGLIHEHQNPRGNIPWNLPAVYEYYRRTQGWDAATTRAQVLSTFDARVITNDGFDAQSIMLYPIPAEHLTDPRRAVGMNRAISAGDCRLVGRLYPAKTLTEGLRKTLENLLGRSPE